MLVEKNKIEDLILELGLIDPEDFVVAEQEAQLKGVGVSQILVRQGLLSEQELREVQMKASGVPFVNLSHRKVDPAVLAIIPEPVVRQFGVLAFEKDDKNLKVALLDLDNLGKVDFLKKKIGLRIIPYLTDKTSLNKALLQYQEFLKSEYGQQIQKDFLAFQTISEELLDKMPREALLELARGKQINTVFELLLRHALLQKATNIHIEPQEDNVLVRYRIGGILYPAMVLPKKSALVLALKIKISANLKTGIVVPCQNGRFQLGFDGEEIDLRVHLIPSVWGEKIVLNILQTGDSGFSLEAIGFHGQALERLYASLSKKEKMILIAGADKSGRTTTFYTLLDLLKNPNLSVATVEKQIGFQMGGINQTVVQPKIGLGILEGVTQLAKQDCDVVAVDELEGFNSNYSAQVLLKLAQIVNEDRFVSVVVKTEVQSSAEILLELADTDRFKSLLIINSLGLIIWQTLIPRISQERQEYYLSVADIKKISREVDLEKVMTALLDENVLLEKKPWTEIKFFKSMAQNKDNQKIMVGEVLPVSFLIKELLQKRISAKDLEKQAQTEGMLSLKEEIFFKAVQGLVSIERILG